MAGRSRSAVEVKTDYSKVDLDLLSNLFGIEEARKQLLKGAPAQMIKPEQILKDADAVALMLRTYPWKIYEQAVWRRLLGSIHDSLGCDSVEKRESARNRTMAYLSVLHLPFELSAEKERILKMQELMKAAQQTI